MMTSHFIPLFWPWVGAQLTGCSRLSAHKMRLWWSKITFFVRVPGSPTTEGSSCPGLPRARNFGAGKDRHTASSCSAEHTHTHSKHVPHKHTHSHKCILRFRKLRSSSGVPHARQVPLAYSGHHWPGPWCLQKHFLEGILRAAVESLGRPSCPRVASNPSHSLPRLWAENGPRTPFHQLE